MCFFKPHPGNNYWIFHVKSDRRWIGSRVGPSHRNVIKHGRCIHFYFGITQNLHLKFVRMGEQDNKREEISFIFQLPMVTAFCNIPALDSAVWTFLAPHISISTEFFLTSASLSLSPEISGFCSVTRMITNNTLKYCMGSRTIFFKMRKGCVAVLVVGRMAFLKAMGSSILHPGELKHVQF